MEDNEIVLNGIYILLERGSNFTDSDRFGAKGQLVRCIDVDHPWYEFLTIREGQQSNPFSLRSNRLRRIG